MEERKQEPLAGNTLLATWLNIPSPIAAQNLFHRSSRSPTIKSQRC